MGVSSTYAGVVHQEAAQKSPKPQTFSKTHMILRTEENLVPV